MDHYDEIDWASILRNAAGSLEDEGRRNQGGVLRDAAKHIDHLSEEIESLKAALAKSEPKG